MKIYDPYDLSQFRHKGIKYWIRSMLACFLLSIEIALFSSEEIFKYLNKASGWLKDKTATLRERVNPSTEDSNSEEKGSSEEAFAEDVASALRNKAKEDDAKGEPKTIRELIEAQIESQDSETQTSNGLVDDLMPSSPGSQHEAYHDENMDKG
jgi:lipoate-protein ligase A